MPGTHWGVLEQSLIYQMNTLGRSVEEVVIPGKNQHAIRTKARRLLLIPSNPPREEWTRRQISILRKLKKKGYSAKQIFESGELGLPYRSLHAVRKEWGRKKLSDAKLRRASRRKKIWKTGEFDAFIAYLLENSQTKTPQQIAKHWKISRGRVSRWQHELGVKLSWHEVMALPYSRAKQKKSKKVAQQKLAKIRNAKLVELIDKLDREAEQYFEKFPNAPSRVCACCKKKLPLKIKFFHYAHRKSRNKKFSTMTCRIYKRRCRICVNQSRRQKTV